MELKHTETMRLRKWTNICKRQTLLFQVLFQSFVFPVSLQSHRDERLQGQNQQHNFELMTAAVDPITVEPDVEDAFEP